LGRKGRTVMGEPTSLDMLSPVDNVMSERGQVSGKKKKEVGESPPIADLDAFAAWDQER
jgi:hypothetical protein